MNQNHENQLEQLLMLSYMTYQDMQKIKKLNATLSNKEVKKLQLINSYLISATKIATELDNKHNREKTNET